MDKKREDLLNEIGYLWAELYLEMHNLIYSKLIVTEISTKIFLSNMNHKQPNFKGKTWSKNQLSTYNLKEISTYIN